MAATVMELYGSKVFNEHEMRERLPSSTYKSLKATIEKGQPLDLEVANVVASVMKRWAIEQGATHYTPPAACAPPPRPAATPPGTPPATLS
mgnify:CR=1 FL=1